MKRNLQPSSSCFLQLKKNTYVKFVMTWLFLLLKPWQTATPLDLLQNACMLDHKEAAVTPLITVINNDDDDMITIYPSSESVHRKMLPFLIVLSVTETVEERAKGCPSLLRTSRNDRAGDSDNVLYV